MVNELVRKVSNNYDKFISDRRSRQQDYFHVGTTKEEMNAHYNLITKEELTGEHKRKRFNFKNPLDFDKDSVFDHKNIHIVLIYLVLVHNLHIHLLFPIPKHLTYFHILLVLDKSPL